VNAVGARELRDIGAVVDDDQRPGGAADHNDGG
jgi:hypothetical protein